VTRPTVTRDIEGALVETRERGGQDRDPRCFIWALLAVLSRSLHAGTSSVTTNADARKSALA